MRLKASLFFAFRAFFGRKTRAGGPARGRNYLKGAVLGVALSIVPFTVVLFVADGMVEGITRRYLETSTYHLQTSPYYSKDLADLEAAASAVAGAEGVVAAFAEYQGPAIALGAEDGTGEDGGSEVYGALVRAVDPALLADPGFKSCLHVIAGDAAFKRDNDVILGAALARRLRVAPGDLVSFLTARESSGASSAADFKPKLTTLKVRAVVSTGYEELDSLWAFVPIAAGERMLAPGTRRVLVGVKVADPWSDLGAVSAAVGLAANSGASPDWHVDTWREVERNLWKSFATTKSLLTLVMALAVAVAAVNVSSALIMLALERKRDIAILKSSGATQGQIAAIFVTLGAMTGVAGVLAGLLAGSAISYWINGILYGLEAIVNAAAGLVARLAGGHASSHISLLDPAYYLESIPVELSLARLAFIAAVGIGLCVLASLLPARKAARQTPLEIFRKT